VEIGLPGGRRVRVGEGETPRFRIRLEGASTLARIMASPSLGAGEAYMDGRLVIEEGDLHGLIDLATRGQGPGPYRPRPGWLRRELARLQAESNGPLKARRNVAWHYDLDAAFYRSFLDADLQYSCAYFTHPDLTLEGAQLAKKRLIASKLDIRPHHRVLDIGCGWGGLALSLAKWTGARVEGITLSTEQLSVARARAREAGLQDRVTFSLTDYRQAEGPFDRIVSVGMFEHVGRPNYASFFNALARLMTPDGVALVHSIGRMEGPSTTDPFTAKYIFPGGYIPALSEVWPAVEGAGLWVCDLEILRLHYAETLRHWRERFASGRDAHATLRGERFCRMWEFYLSTAEVAFRHGGQMNFQIQLTRERGALPITRDYMATAVRRLAALDEGEAGGTAGRA
jgi:cyclopropane-fatty-acyl-phospholipid synthase